MLSDLAERLAQLPPGSLAALDTLVDLLPVHWHVPRGIDPGADLITLDAEDGDDDGLGDAEPLAGSACEYQHGPFPFPACLVFCVGRRGPEADTTAARPRAHGGRGTRVRVRWQEKKAAAPDTEQEAA